MNTLNRSYALLKKEIDQTEARLRRLKLALKNLEDAQRANGADAPKTRKTSAARASKATMVKKSGVFVRPAANGHHVVPPISGKFWEAILATGDQTPRDIVATAIKRLSLGDDSKRVIAKRVHAWLHEGVAAKKIKLVGTRDGLRLYATK